MNTQEPKNNIVRLNIFDKKYNVWNEKCCDENSNKRTLYTELTDICNAACDFCSNKDNARNKGINLNYYKQVLDELIVNAKIVDKISLTGGEPLLYNDLEELLNLLDSYLDKGLKFYVLTTNGILLKDKMEILSKSKIKYINISRHHFDDYINNLIFKRDVPTIYSLTKSINMMKHYYGFKGDFRLNLTLTEDMDYIGYLEAFIETVRRMTKHILIRRDYNEPFPQSLYHFIENNRPCKGKCSDKCQCMVFNINGVNVEIRDVNVIQESNNEAVSQKYIRNFVYSANDVLYGGWDKNSKILFKGMK